MAIHHSNAGVERGEAGVSSPFLKSTISGPTSPFYTDIPAPHKIPKDIIIIILPGVHFQLLRLHHRENLENHYCRVHLDVARAVTETVRA